MSRQNTIKSSETFIVIYYAGIILGEDLGDDL